MAIINQRNSSIELLRIVAMLMVLMLHFNSLTLGVITDSNINQTPILASFRIFLEQATLICVNVFILISGYFGIRPTFCWIKTFLFQILFYTILLLVLAIVLKWEINWMTTIKAFYFGSTYWYVPAFIILYILSPILNKYLDNSPPREILYAVIVFYFVQFIYGYVIDAGGYMGGYSALSFIGLYMLGRCVKNYKSKLLNIRMHYYITTYVFVTLLSSTLVIVGLKYLNSNLHLDTYNSPFILLSSVIFFLIFLKINIKSTLVNKCAKSVFAVYIIHLSPIISSKLFDAMRNLYEIIGPVYYFIIMPLLAIVIILLCILVDQIRIIVDLYIGRINIPYKNVLRLKNKICS